VLVNRNGAQEVETKRLGGDEEAPLRSSGNGTSCATAHTRNDIRAELRTGTHEKEEEKELMIIRALEKGLKYIQNSLYLHIRYSMIRVKHVEGERQRMKER
jgi:hypothetical protein